MYKTKYNFYIYKKLQHLLFISKVFLDIDNIYISHPVFSAACAIIKLIKITVYFITLHRQYRDNLTIASFQWI